MSKANKAEEAANEYLRTLDFGYEADTFADFKEGFIKGVEYANLKNQEQAKHIERLNSYITYYQNEYLRNLTKKTKEIKRLKGERDNSLKEKMYFNRMKELVSKIAYDSEHYTPKTYEVLRNDAITLLDEYKNNH